MLTPSPRAADLQHPRHESPGGDAPTAGIILGGMLVSAPTLRLAQPPLGALCHPCRP